MADSPIMFQKAQDPMCQGSGSSNQGNSPARNITPNGLVQYRDEHPKRPDELPLASLSIADSPKELDYPTKRFIQSPLFVRQTPNPAYCASDRAVSELPLIKRDGENKTGRELRVTINAYPILKLPTKTVYQYEVNAVSAGGLEHNKRILRNAFNCDLRKLKLPDAIWDGGNNAWSMIDLPEGLNTRVQKARVNQPRNDSGDDGVQFSMIKRRELDLSVIQKWLNKRHPYDQYVIEALNFLDHLIREYPATQHAATKRAYFFENLHEMEGFEQASREQMSQLGSTGATVYRGIFQTIRPSPHGLYLNMDTAYGVFYTRGSLLNVIKGLLHCPSQDEIWKYLVPNGGTRTETPGFSEVDNRIRGLTVSPYYEGCPYRLKPFRIANMINAGAREYMLTIQDKATGATNRCTIEQYFQQKYNLKLQYPNLPLVQMENRAVIYPMELLVVKGLQRWPVRLTDLQSRMMIQFAAAKPAQRMRAIELGKKIIGHDNDPVLKAYGFSVGNKMLQTTARLLPSPEIKFGNSSHNPGVSGRWDLRGKTFLKSNDEMLQAWGVGYFADSRNAMNTMQLEQWSSSFMRIYRQHGGLIRNPPRMVRLPDNIPDAVLTLYNDVGRSFNREPQLLIFIVGVKDSWVYTRIKKNCDCRFGVPSQVLLSTHCIRNQAQYHSNVLMKVNAKLGGLTSQVVPTSKATAMRPGTVIIGADVTHPMMGVYTPSLAALSLSNDANGVSYMGNCQVNGAEPMKAKEIIDEGVMKAILSPLMQEWIKTHKGVPENIYYLRDGVSESEYNNVLSEEVRHLRQIMSKCSAIAGGGTAWQGKITVVIANKRHHLRVWPDPHDRACTDKYGNPHPGTLVDRTVVNLHGWDFLLYAHTALQGTARPVHYKVILDEIGHKPAELENMIYEQSYQYLRSTTSVSIHPAIYYAHLISVRARHHEDIPSSRGPQTGRDIKMYRWVELKNLMEKKDRTAEEQATLDKALPKSRLLAMKETENRLMYKMWWM